MVFEDRGYPCCMEELCVSQNRKPLCYISSLLNTSPDSVVEVTLDRALRTKDRTLMNRHVNIHDACQGSS